MRKTLFISTMISFVIFILFSPVFIRLVSYLHPIVLVVVLLCIVWLVIGLVLFIRKETINLPYPLFLVGLTLYSVALVILLFFRPNEQSYNSMNLVPFSTVAFYLSGKVNWLISFYNLAANIGLFIPYGLFLRFKRFSQWKAIFIASLIIACIEVFQFVSHRGSLDIDDLILNLLGIYLGCVLFPLVQQVVNIPNTKGPIDR
ncbi:VanZ family protein [Bacillus sp. AFS031507]|uniref:VanZ family protein n=1 Tax=Bacillus sp. AFS031507 TaxID=2033496 RepID=UPI000BFCEA3A|nr:VanZ family protein [Bacillus sp. AFS031507]PGY06443.1 VanZ family protein [Bacillus sp. AFS031507]